MSDPGRPRRLAVVLSTIFAVRGGIPRFNQMLCMALDRLAPELGLEVVVISQDDTHDHYRAAGSPWKHLRLMPGGGSLRLTLRSLALCARRRQDGMLIGLIGMTPVGRLCRPWLRHGYAFIAHGQDIWEETRASRIRGGRQAKFALAVSNFTAAAVREKTGLPRERIHLLPNTLDPGFHALPDEPQGGVAGDPPELLTVSRLIAGETMKGVDHTIRAFAELSAKHPKVVFRIVGRGSDKPRLERLAMSLGLGERVRFEEDLNDEELAERYRNCSAFVLPSGQEGFGIVFLEAMRFGKACVGGNAGGTPDVVVDGETGFLVPFGELPPLVRALDELLSHPELAREMGQAGRERLERKFVFERYQEWLAGYLSDWP